MVKAMAVSTVVAVASTVGVTGFWLTLAARFWSANVPLVDGILTGSLHEGWRGAGLAVAAAWIGFAITMLSRSTVFTLGLLLGLSLAGSVLIGALFSDPGWVDPTINAKAVIQDDTTYYVDETTCSLAGDCDYTRTRSAWGGLAYLSGLTAALTVASIGSFRRRDVP